jgi:IclR family acetate operon transcriptional repressor
MTPDRQPVPVPDAGAVRRVELQPDDEAPDGTQVVGRVFDILDAFVDVPEGLTVAEVGRAVRLKYATAHRLLEAMARRGILVRDPDTKRYRIGPRLAQLAAQGRTSELERARPHLEWLTEQTGESSHLAVLDGGWALYVDNVASPRLLSPHRHVGRRLPAHCTGVGKALIAFLDEPELRPLMERGLARLTARTIVDPLALRHELETVRLRGYAVDDEETEDGLVCVAAPVRGPGGRVVAAVSVGGPASRLRSRIPETAHDVIRCAERISGSQVRDAEAAVALARTAAN